MGYEALGEPRFVVEQTPEGELVRIRARRQVFVLLFLPVWLAGWTFGGVAAITQLAHQFNPFLCFWLCGWAVGWVFVTVTLCWMIFGSETLRIVDRDLELGLRIGPWTRRKVYQGSRITGLRASAQNDPFAAFRLSGPFMRNAQGGAVQFNYGARTIRAAVGLDEAEGELIVERLRARLPASAVSSAR